VTFISKKKPCSKNINELPEQYRNILPSAEELQKNYINTSPLAGTSKPYFPNESE
jgi:hypothetical protein